ncbi:acyltransferase [Flavobacterium lacustre]|uniref:acyltransferase n=1 Tax=Flavobacterium lacustre TaxID=3016339 RepID=UPI0022B7207B|nr:acyltransferase [Flavobacterium lacustre]
MINKVISRVGIIFNAFRFHLKGVKYGKRIRIKGYASIKIGKEATITIGDNFVLISGNMYNSIGRNIESCIRVDDHAEIVIGNDVGMSNVSIWSKKSIYIGNNVKIGADTIIVDSDMHSMNYLQRRNVHEDSQNAIKKPIHIGNDVFIGTRSIICKGVSIGDNSIIGAGSIVVKDIPINEIWAGNPARFIKKII